ncbi:MAG: ATP-binding cassette domain-containing protein [Methylococcaceae bacterium]|nr:ATP-binding cassette domain-containing protein [Methylococcaceae bacterium]
MSELVKATGLYRYYGKHCAVKDLSFSLNKGEVLGFLGANGAGKTTTMQMLCGNLAPSAGEIYINGFDLLKKPQQAKLALGYLPDTPPLYKDLSVDEFLHYCAQLHRVSKPQIQKVVKSAVERCGLYDVSNRLIVNLSKGYQQRVGIAQAILHNPEVIILDEPTVGLDPIQIKEIRSLIKELGTEHGIILSTHILPEVQESCSHVQIIHQGELVLKETVAGLNQQMGSSRIQLTTRKAVDINKLNAIDAVTNIETQVEGQYLIHHQSTANPLEALTEIVIAHGWGLEEISPVKRSLEDVFINLTNSSKK